MDNKKKGLADTGDGEFILNESGTSVSTDKVEDAQAPEAPADKEEIKKNGKDRD